MSQKEIAFKLEGLKVSMEKICSLQSVLFTILYCKSGLSIKDMEWAFALLVDTTWNMLGELKDFTNDAFENIGKDMNCEL